MEAYDLRVEPDGATAGSTPHLRPDLTPKISFSNWRADRCGRASMASWACVWRSILATAYQPEGPSTSAEI